MYFIMIIYSGEKDQQERICRGIRSSVESNEGSWDVRTSLISDSAITDLDNSNYHLLQTMGKAVIFGRKN